MTSWQPRLFLEAELKKLDDRMTSAPGDAELSFDRAVILTELGRTDEARAAYLELLSHAPTHFGALNNLGALLNATGFYAAARTSYTEAVKHHPDNPMGHINLANALSKSGEVKEAREHFETALRLAPDHPEAHQGLAYLLTDTGDEELAREHRTKGFKDQPILIFPYRGKDVPIAVLLLSSAIGGTVPIRHHLSDSIFFTSVLFVDFYNPALPFPPHQLVFNVIGDADLCMTSLEAAAKIVQRTNAPIINPPGAVMKTGRAGNAARFAGLPGVITPKIALIPRESLTESALAERGFTFPFLLRSPGFHTGQYFMHIENADALAAALRELPGAELMAIEYLDARASDGKIRKYRVMMIDGKFYPLHAAVSKQWKVHYFSADMVDNPTHRVEDERFLNHMEEVLGPRAVQALRHIHDALGLDYAGVDFGLNENGDVLLFEANATMVVNPPEADARWDYRRAPVQKILDAIHAMLMKGITPGVLAKVAAA